MRHQECLELEFWDWEPKNMHILSLIPDGKFHDYEILLPAGGVNLESIIIGPASVPTDLEITELNLVTLNLEEIRRLH